MTRIREEEEAIAELFVTITRVSEFLNGTSAQKVYLVPFIVYMIDQI